MRRLYKVLFLVKMGLFGALVGLNHGCAEFGVDGKISVAISESITTPDNSLGVLNPNYKAHLTLTREFDESNALSFTLDSHQDVHADVHIEQFPIQIKSTGNLEFVDQIKITLESEVDTSLPIITLVTYQHKPGDPIPTPFVIKAEVGSNLYPYLVAGKAQITVEFEGSIPVGPSQTIQVDGQGVFSVQISSNMKA